MMVVLVLITSCQVSLKPKRGPVIAQTRMTVTANTKVSGRPLTRAAHLAKRVNVEADLIGGIIFSYVKLNLVGSSVKCVQAMTVARMIRNHMRSRIRPDGADPSEPITPQPS